MAKSNMEQPMERCVGCGAVLPVTEGPVHPYMRSSPACFAAFNTLIAAEYSSGKLLEVNRLTVDTWAVQHPGSPEDRRAVQSVGLHLARLMLQLASPHPPREANAVMLDFARHKKTLRPLKPPTVFRLTASDAAPFAGSSSHASKVRDWAEATWLDWSNEHRYIRAWVAERCERPIAPVDPRTSITA